VGPLKVAVVTGDHAGEALDLVADRAAKPTVYVFIQADKWDRPMALFLKTLDRDMEGLTDARSLAVWLSEDVAKSKEYLPRAQQSLQFGRTDLTVFDGDKFGPPGWSVGPDAHLTAVVVKDGKVVAKFGHVSVNETDVPAVLKALKPNP
jgi:hypothetical protein